MNKAIEFLKNNKTAAAKMAVFILVYINQFLSMTGHDILPIDDNQLNDWVSTGITLVVSIGTYATSHGFSKPVNEKDEVPFTETEEKFLDDFLAEESAEATIEPEVVTPTETAPAIDPNKDDTTAEAIDPTKTGGQENA